VGLVLLATLLWTGANAGLARAQSPRAPAASSSFYMKTVSPDTLRRMGCTFGRQVRGGVRPADALVVLAFGSPRFNGWDYGASLFGGRFGATTLRIRVAVQSFVQGYVNCTRWHADVHLRIAVGTSNFGPQVSYGHGRAWAIMVNLANINAAKNGWSGKVDVVGANDIEPGYNSPSVTRRWVRGYDAVNRWPYYNFGSASACPPAGDCQGDWTQEDVWYVSWGAPPAWPLPQIYNPTGTSAEQWFRISLYGQRVHGRPMTFVGVVSQHQACHDAQDPCWGMDNHPWEAWHQLRHALNADPRTAQSHLRWATDISWTS
jgi:hypothetical protein